MDNILKYYEILGLKPGATEEQIKQAYRDLAKVWHPDRFPNEPRLQEKAQEKLKEINLAYDYLKSHIYTPPPDHERSYSEEKYYQEEEPVQEEEVEPEEPQTTYTTTTTYKPASFFSSIPNVVMIVIAIVLIRALYGHFNAPPKPQKTQYKPPLYYPLPSKAFSPVIAPPVVTEKPKFQKPITNPLTKLSPQTSKVIPKPPQDEALKETQDTPKLSEKNLKYAAVKDQIQNIEKKLEEEKEASSQPPDRGAMLPSPQHSISRDYFTIGSFKDEVLAVQGTPSNIIGNTWYYDYSFVQFLDGKVKGYFNISQNLHVKLSPKAGSSLEHRTDYFTIGSSKDEVLAVQGTPSSIIGNTWYYDYSLVQFLDGKVKGYFNISQNLHVKLSPKAGSSLEHRTDYFTIGSSQEEVLAVQGTPSSIIGTTWHYSYSSVEFFNGRVKGYSNISRNLRVKLLPKAETFLQSPSYFTIGSTQDEVLAVQGTPTGIIGNVWHYDYSSVKFLNGKVKGYSDISNNLKVKLQ